MHVVFSILIYPLKNVIEKIYNYLIEDGNIGDNEYQIQNILILEHYTYINDLIIWIYLQVLSIGDFIFTTDTGDIFIIIGEMIFVIIGQENVFLRILKI